MGSGSRCGSTHVDAVYATCAREGFDVISAPENKPWNVREMACSPPRRTRPAGQLRKPRMSTSSMSEALIQAVVDLLDDSLAAVRPRSRVRRSRRWRWRPPAGGREPARGPRRACDAQHEVVVERRRPAQRCPGATALGVPCHRIGPGRAAIVRRPDELGVPGFSLTSAERFDPGGHVDEFDLTWRGRARAAGVTLHAALEALKRARRRGASRVAALGARSPGFCRSRGSLGPGFAAERAERLWSRTRSTRATNPRAHGGSPRPRAPTRRDAGKPSARRPERDDAQGGPVAYPRASSVRATSLDLVVWPKSAPGPPTATRKVSTISLRSTLHGVGMNHERLEPELGHASTMASCGSGPDPTGQRRPPDLWVQMSDPVPARWSTTASSDGSFTVEPYRPPFGAAPGGPMPKGGPRLSDFAEVSKAHERARFTTWVCRRPSGAA